MRATSTLPMNPLAPRTSIRTAAFHALAAEGCCGERGSRINWNSTSRPRGRSQAIDQSHQFARLGYSDTTLTTPLESDEHACRSEVASGLTLTFASRV